MSFDVVVVVAFEGCLSKSIVFVFLKTISYKEIEEISMRIL